jgi:uncharacterized protein YndB with AHSA1/START domain
MTDTIVRVRAMAPAKEVRHALTDRDALRIWFAEHAAVDLPHQYEFWGRYTPEGDAPHQRLVHADDHSLRFSWLLDGVETTTEIRIEEESEASTAISVDQSHFNFQEALDMSTIRGVLQVFWSMAMANLVDYLEGREVGPRTDFATADLRGEVLIDAPVDAVYTSLTDSDQVSAWFGYRIGIEPFVGGRFAMGGFDNPQPAKVVDLDPGRAMSVDWGNNGVVGWELAESQGRTRLTFVQSGFDSGRPPLSAWTGWLAGLSQLRRFHELPDWRPIWLASADGRNAAEERHASLDR